MTFSYLTEKKLLERKLQALEGKNWLPPELLAVISFTAQAQLESQARCVLPKELAQCCAASPLSPSFASAHQQGAPLLERENFPVDRAESAALFECLLAYLSTGPGHLAAPALQLREALGLDTGSKSASDNKVSALQETFDALLGDDADYFARWATQVPGASQLLYFLTYNSMVPSLITIGQAAMAYSLPLWQHGHCPVCGGTPFMGQLGTAACVPGAPLAVAKAEPAQLSQQGSHDKSENLVDTKGQRFHVCSFCRATYRVKRLQCPFCLEEDHTKLEYFSADAESGYQVHVCHSCKGYIKIADFREYTDRPSLPALNDLESLPLDIAAQQQGFSRLTLSAWGF